MTDDNIQHGIDDDPNNDPHKAKVGGGIGGAITGAVAGSAVGPLGTIGGAIVGGVVGAFASEAAVKEVDKYDNDNTVTGIGTGVTHGDVSTLHDAGAAVGNTNDSSKENFREGYDNATRTTTDPAYTTTTTGTGYTTGTETGYQAEAATTPTGSANGVPGIQTGGVATDGTPDTRGMSEKLADKLTGDHTDDKTGKTV